MSARKELGHIHLDGELHLGLTVGLRRQLIEAGLAEALPWAEDWIQAPISNPKEAHTAQWLFRLGYDRLMGTRSPSCANAFVRRFLVAFTR